MAVEYKDNWNEAMKLIEKYEIDVLTAIGLFVDGRAAALAPKGQYTGGKVGGNLQSSIRFLVDAKNKIAIVGTNVDYAVFVEKGTGIYAADGDGRKTAWLYIDDMGIGHVTKGMEPQPFLTPAAEDNISEIKNIIKKVKFGHGIS